MNLMTKRIEALEAAAAKHYNGVVTKVVRSQSEIEAIARAGLTERFAEADAVFSRYPDSIGVEPYVANAEELRRSFR